ncbi:transcription factor Spt8p [Trichomonascus vanleenenianus]|uniref:WD40 repeat domain-containing protein n=1 Tax=Trichomonascus vanleenenianus TaxID=2268995 RepID=UPI003ECA9BD0
MSLYENDDEDEDLFEDATEGEIEPNDKDNDIEMNEPESQADAEENNDEEENDDQDDEDDDEMQDADNMVYEAEPHPDSLSFKQRNPIHPSAEMTNCKSYDIVPYVACLHASPVYCVDFSWGLKWMFTGGADGFIRRYNFFDSVNGKVQLTVAQRHPFVDSITKSGVLSSYWENEQPLREEDFKSDKDGVYEPKLSPVYSLAVQSEALWLLAGLESGGITLQNIRHSEGQIHAYLDKHKSAVSVLKLDDDETRAISGSWDRNVVEWDLNTGKYTREFLGSSGQIAALDWQPVNGSLISEALVNEKVQPDAEREDDEKSLDSLFGDEDEEEEEEEEKGIKQEDTAPPSPGKVQKSQSVFLSASIDGSVDIWDRRQAKKAGHLYVPEGTPPWTTSACWSIDGNEVFVGRRNSSVDNYDIRKSLVKPQRTFKFPSVSGTVSTVCPMPSGRHLLCGSQDNLRLYDLKSTSKSKVPFYIIPGHHGGVLSTVYVDPSCQFLVTASGSRGWQGNSTDVALVYQITPQK